MKMIEINTTEEYNAFVNANDNILRVIKLGAEWCGPCRVLSNTIDALDSDKVGSAIFAEIDVENDNLNDVVSSLNIRSIPVLIFVKNGSIVEKRIGGISESDFYNLIEKHK
jgi:thioredoxin-like negative regulator of GroEL